MTNKVSGWPSRFSHWPHVAHWAGATTIILIGLTACGGGDETRAADSQPARTPTAKAAALTADTLKLAGNGLAGQMSPSCAERTYSDFIETSLPEQRRLLPGDCRLVADSQPIFSWPQPADRDKNIPWTLVLEKSDGTPVVTRLVNVPRWLAGQTLAAGDYLWTVSYKTKTNQTVTSVARRFTVPAGLSGNLLPGAGALAATLINKAHPRVLPSGASFAGIASVARSGEYRVAYLETLGAADRAAATTMTEEPPLKTISMFPGGVGWSTWLASVRAAADTELFRIELLAYVDRLTENSSDAKAVYAQEGIKHLMALAAWDPAGMTGEVGQAQANRSIHVALSTGLDLFWTKLSESQRATVLGSLRARLADVMVSIRLLDEKPYLSFENTAVQYALRSLLVTAGAPGFDESNAWLQEVWDAYSTILHDKADQDGSVGGGVAYAWWDLPDMARTTALLKVTAGVDMSQRSFIRNFGTYLTAMTAPVIDQFNAFGDGAETNGMYRNYAFDAFRLYAAVTRQPEHEWYWRANPANVQLRANMSPLHFMLLGIAGTLPASAVPAKNAWAFADAGVIASHSSSAVPMRGSFFFKSGTFGSYNHEHADQNSFGFMSKGIGLLISSGYYYEYGSPHHLSVTRATRYKNAITFDGGLGQAEADYRVNTPTNPVFTMQTRGKLLNYLDRGDFVAGTGDASLAYRARNPVNGTYLPLLKDAIRSFVHFRSQGIVVIYDWLNSDLARRWEWNYHALAPFTSQDSSIVVNNASAYACIDHHGVSGSFVQTNGWDVVPSLVLPAQHHGRYTAASASTQAAMVTVIREDCKGTGTVAVSVEGSVATVTVGSQVFVFDRKEITTPQ